MYERQFGDEAIVPTTTTTTTPALPTPAPASSFNLRSVLTTDNLKTASAIALTYHGYRRTGSLIWALIYGLAGRTVPLVAVPVAFGQGFGAKKPCP